MLTTEPQTTRAVNRSAVKTAPTKENRRIQRISLPLPVRVEMRISSLVSWNEVTRLNDVSAFGAGFVLKRPIKRGRIVLLTLPMPRQLRSFDYSEPQYKVWGLVRRCISVGRNMSSPEYSIGVAFIGKSPPVGYLEHPSRLYDLIQEQKDANGLWKIGAADPLADDSGLPKDQRKQTRYFIPESLVLEQADDNGNILFSETTVTENISLGGAAVFSTLEAETGAFVRVKSPRYDIEILAVVRGSRTGADGIFRLHLEFIDRFYPLEGIE